MTAHRLWHWHAHAHVTCLHARLCVCVCAVGNFERAMITEAEQGEGEGGAHNCQEGTGVLTQLQRLNPQSLPALKFCFPPLRFRGMVQQQRLCFSRTQTHRSADNAPFNTHTHTHTHSVPLSLLLSFYLIASLSLSLSPSLPTLFPPLAVFLCSFLTCIQVRKKQTKSGWDTCANGEGGGGWERQVKSCSCVSPPCIRMKT